MVATATRVLGDYEIIKSIGRGTLGSVFLAEHRFIKQQYVLKVLPEELSSDRGFVQRFEEDVRRLATLEHPGIVKVHNVSNADGCFFLVTDCVVDGTGETCNLAQYLRLRQEPLDEEEVFELLSQLAQALDYAHQIKGSDGGIAHRGLKLSNILVSAEPGKGLQVQLSDFGLSRVVGVSAVFTRLLTHVAEGLDLLEGITPHADGTFHYPNPPLDSGRQSQLHQAFLESFQFLAPEQKWASRTDEVGSCSDVYAFGVLAYHLLTRKWPEGVFPPVVSLRSECRRDWDGLIQSCLQNDGGSRLKGLKAALEHLGDRQRGAQSPLLAQQQGNLLHDSPSDDPAPRPVLQSQQLERPSYDPDPASAFEVEPGVKSYQPKGEVGKKQVEPLHTDMVILKGGSFQRGSGDGNRDEMPCHQIHLNSFALDIHPVSNEQFVRFLECMGGEKDVSNQDIIRLRDSRIKRSGGRLSIESGYAKHPVVGVTWYGAVAYARWIGKRLPTEAEWEIAAMGGMEGRPFPTGDDIEKSQANFFSSDTTSVMSYAPNSEGVYDMAGNVYEWCQDWYGYNYYETSVQEPDNPQGPIQGVYRVLRGGCWKSLKEDMRCSHRHRNNPGTVNSTYGFRCAADVQ